MNAALRSFNDSKYGNTLGYQSKFYSALSYKLHAEATRQEVINSNQGCGRLVTLLKLTVSKFNEAKRFI